MDASKIGKLIYTLRIKKNLTQKQLAQKINVTDKAICKWEKGRGCPDITLLPLISNVLDISIESILRGEVIKMQCSRGNMNKLKIYRCKSCANLITSTNILNIDCCGEKLTEVLPQNLTEISQNEQEKFLPKISEVDQSFFVEFNHPMTKQDFISEVIIVYYDRISVINLFAEQSAAFTISQIAGAKIFVMTNQNILIKVL